MVSESKIHYHTETGRTLVYDLEEVSNYGIKLSKTPESRPNLLCHQLPTLIEERMQHCLQSSSEVINDLKIEPDFSEEFQDYGEEEMAEIVDEAFAVKEEFGTVLEESGSVFEEVGSYTEELEEYDVTEQEVEDAIRRAFEPQPLKPSNSELMSMIQDYVEMVTNAPQEVELEENGIGIHVNNSEAHGNHVISTEKEVCGDDQESEENVLESTAQFEKEFPSPVFPVFNTLRHVISDADVISPMQLNDSCTVLESAQTSSAFVTRKWDLKTEENVEAGVQGNLEFTVHFESECGNREIPDQFDQPNSKTKWDHDDVLGDIVLCEEFLSSSRSTSANSDRNSENGNLNFAHSSETASSDSPNVVESISMLECLIITEHDGQQTQAESEKFCDFENTVNQSEFKSEESSNSVEASTVQTKTECSQDLPNNFNTLLKNQEVNSLTKTDSDVCGKLSLQPEYHPVADNATLLSSGVILETEITEHADQQFPSGSYQLGKMEASIAGKTLKDCVDCFVPLTQSECQFEITSNSEDPDSVSVKDYDPDALETPADEHETEIDSLLDYSDAVDTDNQFEDERSVSERDNLINDEKLPETVLNDANLLTKAEVITEEAEKSQSGSELKKRQEVQKSPETVEIENIVACSSSLPYEAVHRENQEKQQSSENVQLENDNGNMTEILENVRSQDTISENECVSLSSETTDFHDVPEQPNAEVEYHQCDAENFVETVVPNDTTKNVSEFADVFVLEVSTNLLDSSGKFNFEVDDVRILSEDSLKQPACENSEQNTCTETQSIVQELPDAVTEHLRLIPSGFNQLSDLQSSRIHTESEDVVVSEEEVQCSSRDPQEQFACKLSENDNTLLDCETTVAGFEAIPNIPLEESEHNLCTEVQSIIQELPETVELEACHLEEVTNDWQTSDNIDTAKKDVDDSDSVSELQSAYEEVKMFEEQPESSEVLETIPNDTLEDISSFADSLISENCLEKTASGDNVTNIANIAVEFATQTFETHLKSGTIISDSGSVSEESIDESEHHSCETAYLKDQSAAMSESVLDNTAETFSRFADDFVRIVFADYYNSIEDEFSKSLGEVECSSGHLQEHLEREISEDRLSPNPETYIANFDDVSEMAVAESEDYLCEGEYSKHQPEKISKSISDNLPADFNAASEEPIVESEELPKTFAVENVTEILQDASSDFSELENTHKLEKASFEQEVEEMLENHLDSTNADFSFVPKVPILEREDHLCENENFEKHHSASGLKFAENFVQHAFKDVFDPIEDHFSELDVQCSSENLLIDPPNSDKQFHVNTIVDFPDHFVSEMFTSISELVIHNSEVSDDEQNIENASDLRSCQTSQEQTSDVNTSEKSFESNECEEDLENTDVKFESNGFFQVSELEDVPHYALPNENSDVIEDENNKVNTELELNTSFETKPIQSSVDNLKIEEAVFESLSEVENQKDAGNDETCEERPEDSTLLVINKSENPEKLPMNSTSERMENAEDEVHNDQMESYATSKEMLEQRDHTVLQGDRINVSTPVSESESTELSKSCVGILKRELSFSMKSSEVVADYPPDYYTNESNNSDSLEDQETTFSSGSESENNFSSTTDPVLAFADTFMQETLENVFESINDEVSRTVDSVVKDMRFSSEYQEYETTIDDFYAVPKVLAVESDQNAGAGASLIQKVHSSDSETTIFDFYADPEVPIANSNPCDAECFENPSAAILAHIPDNTVEEVLVFAENFVEDVFVGVFNSIDFEMELEDLLKPPAIESSGAQLFVNSCVQSARKIVVLPEVQVAEPKRNTCTGMQSIVPDLLETVTDHLQFVPNDFDQLKESEDSRADSDDVVVPEEDVRCSSGVSQEQLKCEISEEQMFVNTISNFAEATILTSGTTISDFDAFPEVPITGSERKPETRSTVPEPPRISSSQCETEFKDDQNEVNMIPELRLLDISSLENPDPEWFETLTHPDNSDHVTGTQYEAEKDPVVTKNQINLHSGLSGIIETEVEECDDRLDQLDKFDISVPETLLEEVVDCLVPSNWIESQFGVFKSERLEEFAIASTTVLESSEAEEIENHEENETRNLINELILHSEISRTSEAATSFISEEQMDKSETEPVPSTKSESVLDDVQQDPGQDIVLEELTKKVEDNLSEFDKLPESSEVQELSGTFDSEHDISNSALNNAQSIGCSGTESADMFMDMNSHQLQFQSELSQQTTEPSDSNSRSPTSFFLTNMTQNENDWHWSPKQAENPKPLPTLTKAETEVPVLQELPPTSSVVEEVSYFLTTVCVAALALLSPSESSLLDTDIIEDASHYFSTQSDNE